MRRLAIDLTPLRSSRDFRLLWLGELVSEAGTAVARVAVFVQVYALTGSAAAVGLVGLVQFLPLAFAAILGGPLIDRHDRRRLLLIGQWGQAAGSAVLLLSALIGNPPLVLVYAGAAIGAGFGGFALSVRSAMTPKLVTTEQLPSALVLNQAMWQTCMIAGPAIGGVHIAEFGLSLAYGVDLASFGATIAACMLMSAQIPTGASDSQLPGAQAGFLGSVRTGWAQITEGFRFLRGRKVLQTTFYVDLVAMIFGMPRALFPVLAITQFHAGSELVGVLFSAVSVGALAGALSAGWVRHVRRQGLAVLWAVALWGAGIVAFGLSGNALVLALGFLAIAGAADVVSAVFRGTILQQTVPDALRGRLSAMHVLVVAGGPSLGDIEAGVVASAFTPMISVVAGGAVCMAGVAILALAVPEFARYVAPDSDPGAG